MDGLLHLVWRGGTWQAVAPPYLLAVPNVTAHHSAASVPTSYCSVWHYNYFCTLKVKQLWTFAALFLDDEH